MLAERDSSAGSGKIGDCPMGAVGDKPMGKTDCHPIYTVAWKGIIISKTTGFS